MSPRKVVVAAAVAVAAFVLVTTIAIYALWSGGEEPPSPVTTLRQ